MASTIQVDKIQDTGGNTILSSNSTGTFTYEAASGANFTALPAANLTGTIAAISGANVTSLDADNVSAGTLAVARGGTGTTSYTPGITAASQWRLTTSFTGAAEPIASNLEVVDTYGYGSLGSAMTESSGIFTFPSTGYWFIEFTADMYYAGDSRYNSAKIQTTTNDSSYNTAAQSNDGIAQAESSTTSASAKASFIFDVTSTSTHKVRFTVAMSNASVVVFADTSFNLTYMTFIRLGDT